MSSSSALAPSSNVVSELYIFSDLPIGSSVSLPDYNTLKTKSNNIQHWLNSGIQLSIIFSYLNDLNELVSCACVCRSFYHGVHHPFTWKYQDSLHLSTKDNNYNLDHHNEQKRDINPKDDDSIKINLESEDKEIYTKINEIWKCYLIDIDDANIEPTLHVFKNSIINSIETKNDTINNNNNNSFIDSNYTRHSLIFKVRNLEILGRIALKTFYMVNNLFLNIKYLTISGYLAEYIEIGTQIPTYEQFKNKASYKSFGDDDAYNKDELSEDNSLYSKTFNNLIKNIIYLEIEPYYTSANIFETLEYWFIHILFHFNNLIRLEIKNSSKDVLILMKLIKDDKNDEYNNEDDDNNGLKASEVLQNLKYLVFYESKNSVEWLPFRFKSIIHTV